MTLSVDESKSKYNSQITGIKKLISDVEDTGFSVQKKDAWELEGTICIIDGAATVAELYWNVPYYLKYDAIMSQDQESFDIDYVKNIDDWKQFLNDIKQSLVKLRSTKDRS